MYHAPSTFLSFFCTLSSPLSSPHPLSFTILLSLLQCHSPSSFLSPSYILLHPPLFNYPPSVLCFVLLPHLLLQYTALSSFSCDLIHPLHLQCLSLSSALFSSCILLCRPSFSTVNCFLFPLIGFFPPSAPLPLLYHAPYSILLLLHYPLFPASLVLSPVLFCIIITLPLPHLISLSCFIIVLILPCCILLQYPAPSVVVHLLH